MAERPASIYVLIDPRDQEIRYVGKTQHDITLRASQHCADARAYKRSRVHRWILELLRQGYRPIVELVQAVDPSEWQIAERYWIGFYKSQGCSLTNTAPGGGRTTFVEDRIGFQFRPTTSLYEAIKRVARDNGISFNQWVIDVIREELNQEVVSS